MRCFICLTDLCEHAPYRQLRVFRSEAPHPDDPVRLIDLCAPCGNAVVGALMDMVSTGSGGRAVLQGMADAAPAVAELIRKLYRSLDLDTKESRVNRTRKRR